MMRQDWILDVDMPPSLSSTCCSRCLSLSFITPHERVQRGEAICRCQRAWAGCAPGELPSLAMAFSTMVSTCSPRMPSQ